MAKQFSTDAEVLAALKMPTSLAYAACSIGVSLERARTVLAANKLEVLKERVEVYKQEPAQLAFHLEQLQNLTQIKDWYSKNYGAKT